MTVSAIYAALTYNGSGSAGPFNVTWPFVAHSDLHVTHISATGVETVKSMGSHYTVTGGADADGVPGTGTITMQAGHEPATGTQLRIERITPKTQSRSLPINGSFPAKGVEAALDRHTLMVQEVAAQSLSDNVMTLDRAGATDFWDARDKSFRNVPDATDDDDVLTRGYADQRYSLTPTLVPTFDSQSAAPTGRPAVSFWLDTDDGRVSVNTGSAYLELATAAQLNDLVNGAPAALNQLNELAAALGNDANYAATVTTALAGKAPLSHNHTAADITDFAEATDDRVAALLQAGSNITLTYNDALNTLTIAAASAGGLTASALAGDLNPVIDVASASTCDIGAAASQRVRITGTTTITSFGTSANRLRFVVFAGALTLTHNGTSLILPRAANITTVAGDSAVFMSDGSGNWTCVAYHRTDGGHVTLATQRLVGRNTAGTGAPEEVSLTQLLDWIGSAARGDILFRGASSWQRLPAGTAGQVLQTGGAGADPSWVAASGGKLVSRSYAEYTANATISTAIPYDDTVPTDTEGTEILTTTITPASVSNRVQIAVSLSQICGPRVYVGAVPDPPFNVHNNGAIAVSVFRGSTCIDARTFITDSGNGAGSSGSLVVEDAPGATTTQTYSVRVGTAIGGSFRLNGTDSARRFGGASRCTLVATEITP